MVTPTNLSSCIYLPCLQRLIFRDVNDQPLKFFIQKDLPPEVQHELTDNIEVMNIFGLFTSVDDVLTHG